MKIVISGTHGTGKTTLVRELALALKIPIVREGARSLIRAFGFQRAKDMPNELAGIFQHAILGYKILEQEKYKSYVADRGAFGAIPYYLSRCVESAQVKALYQTMAIKVSMDYDYIFYLPIEYGLDDDGLRGVDFEYQKKIDKEIRELIKKYLSHIPFIEVTGQLDERIHTVLKRLSNDKALKLQLGLRLNNEV